MTTSRRVTGSLLGGLLVLLLGWMGSEPVVRWLEIAASPEAERWVERWRTTETPVVVGEEEDLPSSLPGPADAWGGGTSRSLAVRFTLDEPLEGEVVFRLELHDTHEALPPVLRVRVNGKEAATIHTAAGHGAPPPHAARGAPASYVRSLPAELFHAPGENRIEIANVEGSWVAPARLVLHGAATEFRPSTLARRLFVEQDKFGRLALTGILVFGVLLTLRPRGRIGDPQFFVGVFAVALVVSVALNHRLEGLDEATGDEPWYLLMTRSLALDGDVNIANQIAAESYREFYSGGWGRPQAGDRQFTRDGTEYYFSVHDPGLPLLLTPAYAWFGYPEALIVLNGVFALTVAMVALWLRKDGFPASVVFLVTALVTLSMPVLFYSCRVFPDPVAGAAILAGALAIVHGTARPFLGAGVLAVSVTALPWLHLRFVLPAAILVAVGLVRFDRRDCRALLVVAVAVTALGLVLYSRYPPEASDLFWSPALLSVTTGLREGWWGLLFDIQKGLLFYAPAYLLALAGLGAWFRRDDAAALLVSLLVLSNYLVAGAYGAWDAGVAPPGRYLLPTLPLLAPAIAWTVVSCRSSGARLGIAALGVWSVGLGLYLMRVPHHQVVHTAWVEEIAALVGVGLFPVLPDFIHLSWRSYATALVWGAAAGATVWLYAREVRSGACSLYSP